MKYNILGDIHGRTCWKELVKDDCVNVFVGDYFSPYDKSYDFEHCKQNFFDILQYKKEHPETILLIGNHDEDHWHIFDDGVCRHDYEHDKEIQKLFEDNKDMFVAAASLENIVLVTHAGVSDWWYNRRVNGVNERMETDERKKLTPDMVAKHINELWHNDPKLNFGFGPNSRYSDCYGVSEFQSPMWIRCATLELFNIFEGTHYIQVYGHTQGSDIYLCSDDNGETGVMFDVDCLGNSKESLLIEINENEVNIEKNKV